MDIRSFLKTFVQNYFLIYALTIIASFFFLIAQGITTLTTDYLWLAALFSLAADAPLVVFITKKGEEVTHYALRSVIQLCLLEALLMPIGHAIGMWSGIGGAFAFFFTVLAVDAVMHLLNFLGSTKLSSDINKIIKSRRHAKSADDKAVETVEGDGAAENDVENVSGGNGSGK